MPLYSGPQVTIRIPHTDREFKLSKALVCEHSSVFKASFDGDFREGQEQAHTLKEEDGVVSVRSLELLVQWIYQGQVLIDDSDASESISTAIEFARLADMYQVTGMERPMAEHIKKQMLRGPPPFSHYDFDSNTYYTDPGHITSAVQLPSGHPVREILATASVRDYFRHPVHKFVKECEETPGFAWDLLQAVKAALDTLNKGNYKVSVTNPLSGEEFYLT